MWTYNSVFYQIYPIGFCGAPVHNDGVTVPRIRKIMDDAGVQFQTCELGKVDAGGGGTIAYIPAKYGMDVIDSGVAVLSMHSPWEPTSKADIYEAERGYEAFLRA